MSPCKLTAEQEAEALRRYEAGETTRQVGTVLGVNSTTISNTLRRHGVQARSNTERFRAERALTPGQEDQACQRYLAGESTVQLGKAFGVASSTIWRILRRHGIQPRAARSQGSSTLDELTEGAGQC